MTTPLTNLTAPSKPTTDSSGMEIPFKNLAAALAAGTAAGVYLTGSPAMNVATAMDGALGATVGLALAPYIVTMPSLNLSSDQMQTGIMAAGVALPALVAMKIDMPIVAIGAAATAGYWAVTQYLN